MDATSAITSAPPSESAATSAPFPTTLASSRVLPGVLTRPVGVPSRGCLLLLHGMASHCDHSFAPQLASSLSQALGCCVYRYSGRGPAPDPAEPAFRYRISGAPTDDVADLEAAIAACLGAGLGPLLALVGYSRGANTVIFYAARAQAALPCVCISPRHNMEGMLASRIFTDAQRAALDAGESIVWATKQGPITVTPQDAADIRALGTMEATVRALSPAAPLLVVHGEADATIPCTDSQALVACRGAHATELALVPGARHNFEKKEAVLLQAVLGFLAKHLG